MKVSEIIKLLTGVETDTDNLKLLRENPEEHVAEKSDLDKLEQLFYLLDMTDAPEDL